SQSSSAGAAIMTVMNPSRKPASIRRTSVLGIALLALDVAMAGAQSRPSLVPVDFYRNSQILVKARVNGSAPMWFIFDSGSTWSFLDDSVAVAMGITTTG